MSPKSLKRGRTHKIVVDLDEDLWLRLKHISTVTRIPQSRLVASGLRLKFKQLKTYWPSEWLDVPSASESER